MTTERSNTLSQTILRYIKYRTAQLEYEEGQIGQPGPINVGSHLAKREAITMARWTLRELESMAGWIDGGSPEFEPPLSLDEKEFWRKAKARGIEVPADIEVQL